MTGKSPQKSSLERTTAIANLVKHRNLQAFGTEMWVNTLRNLPEDTWTDRDSVLHKMGHRALSSGDDKVRLSV